MKKLLSLFVLVTLLSCHSATKTDSVYVCTGRYAHAYHSSADCRGILACKAEIQTIKLSEAQSAGRTPCHYCCK